MQRQTAIGDAMHKIHTAQLASSISVPSYDRAKLKTRIVHLGFGAFHRAHQALYTELVAREADSDWGICEISLFSDRLIKALRAQDHLYSVIEKGAEQTRALVVGVVTEAMTPGLDGVCAVIEKLAEPDIAIVSLTITEKGYCIDPATGALDRGNAMVIADLETPEQPKSALGYIVQGLKLRRARGLPAFTVLSCDNIQGNGQVALAAVVDFARELDPDLADWIAAEARFPCTMVDRIVPAVTAETEAEITDHLGLADPCGIVCEPFTQWVIEDQFVAGRPDWNLAGAEIVEDVLPYEEMKLRLLNGAHSFLAYLGYLAGHAHISDTMGDAPFRKAAFDLMMQCQAPSLDMPDGTDLSAYAQQLIARFTNPALKHQTWQIAMDGSQKIPQRFGGGLRYHIEHGSDFRWLAAGIAGWMRYVSGVDEQGGAIDVRDPLAEDLRRICDASGLNASVVPALLSVDAIFDPEIGQNPRVIEAVSEAYSSLISRGARATVAAL